MRQTSDAGGSWDVTLRTIYKKYAEGGMLGLSSLFVMGRISTPVFSPEKPGTLYLAAGTRGVLKSTDGGKTWAEHTSGLDIPKAETVMAPRNTKWLFTGTPGGLFLSKDDGVTWEDANLWLQFEKNTRRELGGAAFIDAYWRARYYGFIGAAAANVSYDGE